MSGFYIDASEFDALRDALGATEKQCKAAYNKAVRQTAAKLERLARATMISGTGVKGRQIVRGRVRVFVSKGKGEKPGGGKIWFGLDSLPVSSLRGKIKPQSRRKPKRGSDGRFIKGRGAAGASFTPQAADIPPLSFPNSFVAKRDGRRTIWVRNTDGRVNEARVPIYEPMLGQIDSDVFVGAGDMLLDYFSKDLRGRVAGGIK
ncbi:hypothetical protein FNI11_13615 [Salmonella enterica subsp. salamae]|nr:hypothetical protein [Salmonella enterica subsp. salamae]ECJ2281390.1 hypothetical protein [Salmonella enterica subsp. salamae]